MLVAMTLLAQVNDSESNRQIPFSPLLFGIIAFSIILAMLAVTWAFRSVGKRH